MRNLLVVIGLFFVFSCNENSPHQDASRLRGLEESILELENEAKLLMKDMDSLNAFAVSLLKDHNKRDQVSKIYEIVDGISTNRPGDGQDLSTIYVSSLQRDKQLIQNEIAITDPLDSAFKHVLTRNPMVAQVYTNSANQISRVYPAYDALSLMEPDLDITAFNFYYEANETNNPERVSKWLPDAYVDPAGRGWIVSLVSPVYLEDKLRMVLGIDIRINEALDPYLESNSGSFLVVTGKGDIVGGSPEAINALGLPPLKNHIYIETIKADNFRISDYNLFNSKSPEVREMAQELLRKGEDHFFFDRESELNCAILRRFNLVDWVMIEIIND